MSTRAVSPRILLLAAVVATHAGALLVLLAETRTRLIHAEADMSPILVILLRPRAFRAPAAPTGTAARRRGSRSGSAPGAGAEAETPTPITTAASDASIDWAAEATASAARQIEATEQHARQARALAPKRSPMFAMPRRATPGIAWNYAATHRVQPLGGLATAIHVNDNCAIVLFIIVPFAGGCTLEKIPARGDLFDHMHDPDPGPDP